MRHPRDLKQKLAQLKFDSFPVRLFFRLLSKDDALACRVLGENKWNRFKIEWEERTPSITGDAVIQSQRKVFLSLVKMHLGITAFKWVQFTSKDVKPIFLERGLPWDDDPIVLLEKLGNYIQKHAEQYENNLIGLNQTQKNRPEADEQKKTDLRVIDEALASLNLAGFTIVDKNSLTIGEFLSMNTALEKRNGGREN